MAAPTPSWNTVRVFGTWRNLDGSLKAGTYKVELPARVTSSTDDDIIPAGTFTTGNLTTSSAPSLSVLVPATDDPDIEQTGWQVKITVSFTDNSAPEVYTIDVPYANRPTADGGNNQGVDLRQVALSGSVPQTVALYKVGVPGGLARLNDDGNVIDSDGEEVTGAGSASTILAAMPGVVQMVYFTGTAWPSNTAYTDPARSWHFVGGDDTHQAPAVAGQAVWDMELA
jgi:hypothetical protein